MKHRRGARFGSVAPRPPLQLRLQSTQRGTLYRPLNIKALRKVFPKVHDRRKKRKRSRVFKRPSLPKKSKQLILARQLVRKLRSVQRTATRALRRRLLRHKRRYYRKVRRHFNAIRYRRRLRVKRRTVRRVRRYVYSTATVLRGARARVLHRRVVSRKQRAAYVQVSQRGHLLISNSASVGTKLTRRQLLFVRKEQRRRMRALRFLTSRALCSSQAVIAQSRTRARRAAAKLRRRLAGYTSTVAPHLPRPRSGLTPGLFTITPT